MRSNRTQATGASLAVLVALGGCGLTGTGSERTETPAAGSPDVTGAVTLQTWSLAPRYGAYVEGVIAAFEEQYPGTEVTWIDQPGEGYGEEVLAQAAAGDLPDVVNLPPDFALSLVHEGMLADVAAGSPPTGIPATGTPSTATTQAGPAGTATDLEETYVAGALDAYRYAGVEGTYGFPWYLTTDLNYWNTELLQDAGLDPAAPPTTLDELVAQARTMMDRTGRHLISRKPGLGDFAAAGIPVLSDDGSRFTFNTPEAAELLDVYRDAYAAGLLPDSVLTDAYLGNAALFTEGAVAWSTGGGNFIDSVVAENPSLEGKVVPSPSLGVAPLYVQGLSVSSESENLPTALALARFMTGAAQQEAFAAQVPGVFPSTTASQEQSSLAESDGTPQGDARQIAFAGLATARVLQPVEVDRAMTAVVDQQFSAAIAGDTTSQEALDAAVAECDRLLADQ